MAATATPSLLNNLRETLVNRIRQRVQSKRGPMTPPFKLEYRHIFVLPTKFGWGFALMLIFMALGGLNFNNNMALMLVFLLATIAQLTTLIAYRNLSSLKVEQILSEPVFCGGTAHFNIYLANADERRRFAIQVGFKQPQDCKDIELNSCESLQLRISAESRGWLEMPSFRLETRFPLGLFKAWSWIFPQTRCLVYPAPASHAPPLPRTGHGHAGPSVKGDGDEVHGLRKYQAGDSIHRVAWRASARHDAMYSLEMETPREEACALDWNSLKGIDVETRLSILTAWVITADHKQLSYSLQLPDGQVPAGSGTGHRARCLELLALAGC